MESSSRMPPVPCLLAGLLAALGALLCGLEGNLGCDVAWVAARGVRPVPGVGAARMEACTPTPKREKDVTSMRRLGRAAPGSAVIWRSSRVGAAAARRAARSGMDM